MLLLLPCFLNLMLSCSLQVLFLSLEEHYPPSVRLTFSQFVEIHLIKPSLLFPGTHSACSFPCPQGKVLTYSKDSIRPFVLQQAVHLFPSFINLPLWVSCHSLGWENILAFLRWPRKPGDRSRCSGDLTWDHVAKIHKWHLKCKVAVPREAGHSGVHPSGAGQKWDIWGSMGWVQCCGPCDLVGWIAIVPVSQGAWSTRAEVRRVQGSLELAPWAGQWGGLVLWAPLQAKRKGRMVGGDPGSCLQWGLPSWCSIVSC
jgi:hypothetical protein